MNAASGLAATWQAILGAPEFGSAIFGLRAFQGATRSIVLMPAKRGIATYDRNRVAVELAGLAYWLSCDSFVFYHSVPSSLLAFERVSKRKDLQTQELAKGMGQR
jgi:hypothetical protein